MNDSSTGGYLLPTGIAALNDAALDGLFQLLISNLSGIAPRFVRERFSAEPQVPPPSGSTWCAVGVTDIDDDAFPQQEMRSDGTYVLTNQEVLTVLCSFYGPMAQKAARMARNGIQIAQNREAIEAAGIYLKAPGKPIKAPALVENRWQNRIDVSFVFRRAIRDAYAILPVDSAEIEFNTDGGPSTSVTVTSN